MTALLDGSIPPGTLALLAFALTVALGFEFVNGFHDTANAVATVIYTRSLKPRHAVLWSGVCNFLGVHLGGTAVAFGIVHLLPVDLLIRVGSSAGMAMVFAILIAAILWNLGTWALGLPASSSHTLIGAILGVGLVHSALDGSLGEGVNWSKAGEVGLSLLISPVLGFVGAALLLLLFRRLFPDPSLYEPPPEDRPPPPWIRGTLFLTCTGVSVAHGSNDGQKGVGLIMLVLIGLLPSRFMLDASAGRAEIDRALAATATIERLLADEGTPADSPDGDLDRLRAMLAAIRGDLRDRDSIASIPLEERQEVRANILAAIDGIRWFDRHRLIALNEAEAKDLREARASLEALTDYAPTWVLVAVATALGVGTTVGWKRIVVTVGEKIGKSHLTYAQGACAELIAMSMIGVADYTGNPVSTTHVLSSGVAGTMAAQGTGLQFATVRNIALAWILTLPAAMAIAAGLYGLIRLLVP